MKQKTSHFFSKNIFLGLFLFLSLTPLAKASAQTFTVQSNALGWLTASPNVEASMALSTRWTLHLPVSVNQWAFKEDFKWKHIAVQPGVRRWFTDSYNRGFFAGVYGLVANYDVAGVMGSEGRKGWIYGGGLSGGYCLPLNERLNLEFEAGIAGGWKDYTETLRPGKPDQEKRRKQEFGTVPGKLSVNIVYLF